MDEYVDLLQYSMGPKGPPSPKIDFASLEHPIFALRGGDKNIRIYERKTKKSMVRITVKPGADGCATVHDKDLWIYCMQRLAAAKNIGASISRTVRFSAYDFLTSTGRGTSGRAYLEMSQMLGRLAGTRIETNIETAGRKECGFFGLLDSARIVRSEDKTAVEVTLPEWLFRALSASEILTIDPGYFSMRSPIDRRVYELGRKHCGAQKKFLMTLRVLHEKSGSRASLKEFRRAFKDLVEHREIPGYLIKFEPQKDMATWRPRAPGAG